MPTLAVKIIPRSSQNRIVGWSGGGRDELIIKLTAPPTDGQANAELLSFLAKHWRIPKSAIQLQAGQTSRHKRLLISLSDAELQALLPER